MAIKAVIFDIGGVLEIGHDGHEPTAASASMVTKWEARLQLSPGSLSRRLLHMYEQLALQGKVGRLGTLNQAEWAEALGQATGMNEPDLYLFIEDHWRLYLGELNKELAAFFALLRPRYLTALLSNSFIGAREREEERYHFSQLTDIIIYSHEEGISKPDRQIYELACRKLCSDPGQTIFLDDVSEYVAGAQAIGIQAVLYQNTEQAIADIMRLLENNQ